MIPRALLISSFYQSNKNHAIQRIIQLRDLRDLSCHMTNHYPITVTLRAVGTYVGQRAFRWLAGRPFGSGQCRRTGPGRPLPRFRCATARHSPRVVRSGPHPLGSIPSRAPAGPWRNRPWERWHLRPRSDGLAARWPWVPQRCLKVKCHGVLVT